MKHTIILDGPNNERVLKHLLTYATFQFGEPVAGLGYRQRGNGERIDDFTVEINNVIPIYQNFHNTYLRDTSLTRIDRDNFILRNAGKMLEVLQPWSVYLDSRTDSVSKEKLDTIFDLLSKVEQNKASIYSNRNQFDIAENHNQQAVAYARRYEQEGEIKTTLLLSTLTDYSQLLVKKDDLAGAMVLAEDAYNCVAIAYNPVHPQVQKAASILIDCLIRKEDFYNAERFAEMTFENLKDPANKLDQESEAVAKGYYNLGNVILLQKGDLVKAEMLARESLRIRNQIYDKDSPEVGGSMSLLALVLTSQGKFGGM